MSTVPATFVFRCALLAALAIVSLHLRTQRVAADGELALTSSSPAPRSFLTAAPSHVRITVSERVRYEGSFIVVVAPGGAEVNDGPSGIEEDGRTLVVPLQPELPDGLYTVSWGAMALDGEARVEASFDFGLRVGATLPSLRVDRPVVSSGATLGLTGTNFKPGGSVVVSASVDEAFVAAGVADASGVAHLRVVVPADLPNGPQRVTMVDGDGASANAQVQVFGSSAPPIRVRLQAISTPTSVTFQVTVINRSGSDVQLDAIRLPIPPGTSFAQASTGGRVSTGRNVQWDGQSLKAGEQLGPLTATFSTRDLPDGTFVSTSASVHYVLASATSPRATPTAGQTAAQNAVTSPAVSVRSGGLD